MTSDKIQAINNSILMSGMALNHLGIFQKMSGPRCEFVALASSLRPGLKTEVIQVLRVIGVPSSGIGLGGVPQHELEVV